jgi:hypothetical protein
MKRDGDPDETEGRDLYRKKARGMVATQDALASRKVRLVRDEGKCPCGTYSKSTCESWPMCVHI